jgi:hypothetical protein
MNLGHTLTFASVNSIKSTVPVVLALEGLRREARAFLVTCETKSPL